MTREEAIAKIHHCLVSIKDCAGYDSFDEALKMAIKALEQKPCDDAISRDAVWDVMQELWGTSGELLDRLMALPSVNPQEPKTGHWIVENNMTKCSECGRFQRDCRYGHTNYCNHCGAEMIDPQERSKNNG